MMHSRCFGTPTTREGQHTTGVPGGLLWADGLLLTLLSSPPLSYLSLGWASTGKAGPFGPLACVASPSGAELLTWLPFWEAQHLLPGSSMSLAPGQPSPAGRKLQACSEQSQVSCSRDHSSLCCPFSFEHATCYDWSPYQQDEPFCWVGRMSALLSSLHLRTLSCAALP